jgi:hypothetical protein
MNERAQLEWAQQCAALIVESGLTDWQLARRKAAKQWNTAPQVREPNDAQIIDAIKQYHALYQSEEHAEQLAAQREEALSWMEFFEAFAPRLTGPVAEGWAHAESEIRLELTVPDEKLFEIALVNDDVQYSLDDATNAATHYIIDDADWPLRVMLLGDSTRGKARWHADSPRLTTAQVRALVLDEKV